MLLFKHIPYLKEIRDMAKRRKIDAYLIGGFVRDALLDVEKNDFDFALSKRSVAFAQAFAKQIRGAFVLLDEERGCARVAKKMKGHVFTFDFADFRGKDLMADLCARDFTINTLCVHLNVLSVKDQLDEVIIDPNQGRRDLSRGRIKMTSNQVFRDDPLRILRAFTLKATLGFSVAKTTRNRMQAQQHLLKDVSLERIRDELFKILKADACTDVIREMDTIGVLDYVIPQIAVMRDCVQGAFHHLDVWRHSLQAVEELESLIVELRDHQDLGKYLNEPLAGDRPRLALMKLATLLHDIGKPDTRKKEGARYSFHAHERVGGRIVRSVARMLKLSTAERHALEDMVVLHLRPGYLSNVKNPTPKSVYRFFRDAKVETASVLLLSLADQRAARGPMTTEYDQQHHQDICLRLLEKYFEDQKKTPFVPLVNGKDVMRALKIKPSPLVGRILEQCAEEQILSRIKTKAQALVFAQSVFSKEKKK